VSTREGTFEHAGGRTWYRIAGELPSAQPPLLALHGGPGSTHNYFAPLERLADDGRTVVLYDQVGCGRSEKRSGVEWSLDLFVDELDALRDELGLERLHLLGTSWGGMLALEHALRRPGTLASLILSSTLAYVGDWEVEARRLRDELPADVRGVLDRHEAAGTYDDPEYEQAMAVFDARHFHRGEPRPELERMQREKGVAAYRAMVGPNEWTMTGALKGWDVRSRLHELDVPTLVLRGRYDLCTEPIARTLIDGIRGARHVLFEHSSHTPVLEETERYLEVVGGFVDSADERPAGQAARKPPAS
jgi:L-proline amide hydrolase